MEDKKISNETYSQILTLFVGANAILADMMSFNAANYNSVRLNSPLKVPPEAFNQASARLNVLFKNMSAAIQGDLGDDVSVEKERFNELLEKENLLNELKSAGLTTTDLYKSVTKIRKEAIEAEQKAKSLIIN